VVPIHRFLYGCWSSFNAKVARTNARSTIQIGLEEIAADVAVLTGLLAIAIPLLSFTIVDQKQGWTRDTKRLPYDSLGLFPLRTGIHHVKSVLSVVHCWRKATALLGSREPEQGITTQAIEISSLHSIRKFE
jgi:hypothetical protein